MFVQLTSSNFDKYSFYLTHDNLPLRWAPSLLQLTVCHKIVLVAKTQLPNLQPLTKHCLSCVLVGPADDMGFVATFEIITKFQNFTKITTDCIRHGLSFGFRFSELRRRDNVQSALDLS